MARHTVVLVEGESDRVALAELAARRRQDLDGIEVVAMGGITNTRKHALHHGPRGSDHRLAGLYDAAAEPVVRRQLAAAGLAVDERSDLARLGFFRCSLDLEDELISAVGVARVEEVIERAGGGRRLRLLAQMPAQQGWSREALLRRFVSARSGHKALYASLLVAALEPDRAPAPLTALLEYVRSGTME